MWKRNGDERETTRPHFFIPLQRCLQTVGVSVVSAVFGISERPSERGRVFTKSWDFLATSFAALWRAIQAAREGG